MTRYLDRPLTPPATRRQTLQLVAAAAAAAAAVPALGKAAASAAPVLGVGSSPASYLSPTPKSGSFPLVARGVAAPIVVSDADHPGVVRVVGDLQADIERVTGVKPAVVTNTVPKSSAVVIVGTIGRSPLIDGLIGSRKLDVAGIAGKWETSLQQVVNNPMPGVKQALVIAGSDQRGTIYGAYDVSRQAGVSPWYWWDDVPPAHCDELHVLAGRHTQGTPAVKYRGFFINDENPSLGRWAPAYFGPGLAPGYPGGFNSKFWAKIFEVMLRLKANYLWPAVWGRAFAEDDPDNHATAKYYGVVMGTSHEAPMMRGIEEWNRHATAAKRDSEGNITTPGSDPYGGTGEWSFRRNADAIKKYWADGIKRMREQDFEGVVTLGMRGNGDVGLPDGDGIDLMQHILDAERQILAEASGKDVTTIPQVWTLYKEVQRYWDKGLRAPDDVTVVFCDDNWGNMRKLPDLSAPKRAGGYGIYYHFDYVGGGRNYKWVDTVNLTNTWEQLRTVYDYGVDRLWVVNVGDMKNTELQLQFFLDYAWDPKSLPLEKLPEWERRYVALNFGPKLAAQIADVLHDYGVLQARRKPELLNRRITVDPNKSLTDPADGSGIIYDDQGNPFYLENYAEHERVTEQWRTLSEQAERIGVKLPEQLRDAYYQLVLYQVKATANLYQLRLAEFTNLRYADQGRAATNELAALTEARFADDQAMSDYYNNVLAGGKWKGFQTQPKIGYGNVARYGPNAPWQQPELNDEAIADEIFPAVRRIEVPATASLGVAIDGSDKCWPDAQVPAVLPTFSPYQSQPRQYIEIFNRGSVPFDYQISSAQRWVTVKPARGRVEQQVRATVSVDWSRAPKGRTTVPITVTGPDGASVVVQAVIDRPTLSTRKIKGHVEANGYVSIDAAHYSRAVRTSSVRWRKIPDIGRTGDGMQVLPVTAPMQTPGGDSPRLEYTTTLFTTGPVTIWVYLSPRNNTLPTDGHKYAISVDDAEPQVVNVSLGTDDGRMNKQWERNTSDNVNRSATRHTIDSAGVHTVKFWTVDPTAILQKIVIDTGDLRPSYLGPPESRRIDG